MDIPINFAINVKSQGHKSMHYQNFFQKWIFLIPGKILLNNLDDLFSVVSEKKEIKHIQRNTSTCVAFSVPQCQVSKHGDRGSLYRSSQ